MCVESVWAMLMFDVSLQSCLASALAASHGGVGRASHMENGLEEFGIPFSSDSLDILQRGGDTSHITLADGRSFANRSQVKVLGVTVDSRGGGMEVVLAREHAAMGVWLKHRRQLCSPWLTCCTSSTPRRWLPFFTEPEGGPSPPACGAAAWFSKGGGWVP